VTVELLPYGDHALLVEVGDTGGVVAYVDALRSIDHPGVADVVPAARTVLVVAHTSRDVPALRQALADLAPGAADGAVSAEEGVIEIPVRYDGPDLGDVARLTGLSERDVVAAHTRTEWRVAFGGFAPGFGYLVTDHRELHVPRRDSARTAVPAGAVGLAGEYTGVYPRESPGGWQLIGTTDAPMWDLDRDPPALLRPGARVRFSDAGGRA
jgi:KipI family sensor histidine kinase inhibitor